MSFYQLFIANLKMYYRDVGGIFWTICLPVALYVGLSLVPINKYIQMSTDYSTFLLPGMIAYVIMQGGIYGLAYWMVDMRAQGVVKRFLVTPLRQWELALAVVASRLMVMVLQVVVLTAVGIIFFDAVYNWNIVSTLIFTVLGGAIFLMIGLLISTVAGSYQSAAPLTAAIGLPFTILGNIFFTSSALPGALQWVAKVLPITYLSEGLRTVYLNPFSLASTQTALLVLVGWFIVILALTVWRFRLKE